MKEYPILMSQQFIPKILDGTKTQTRRTLEKHCGINKPFTYRWADAVCKCSADGSYISWWGSEWTAERWQEQTDKCYPNGGGWRLPWEVGDVLWVRETWSPDHADFYPHFPIVYRANGEIETTNGQTYSPESKSLHHFRWRPSIHMPRLHARIFLKVNEVRVERLKEITPEDAVAEGIEEYAKQHNLSGYWTTAFIKLWGELYGDTDSNPWVSVTKFELIKDYKPKEVTV